MSQTPQDPPTGAALSEKLQRRKQQAENSRHVRGQQEQGTPEGLHTGYLCMHPPPAPPGGAMVRRPSGLDALEILGRALKAECSWGLAILADGRAAVGAGSLGLRLGGGRVPLRGSSVSHWLPAVSLGTWRRWRLRPFSGWAEGGGESHRTEWRGAEVAGGPLDR